jgi:hypothetical protein
VTAAAELLGARPVGRGVETDGALVAGALDTGVTVTGGVKWCVGDTRTG